MCSDVLKIGFAGAGDIVRQRHVPGLRELPGIVLAGVANRSLQSSQRAAAEFGVERAYARWQHLVESDDADVVWIGTQPYMHHEITMAALKAGTHVFC